MGRSTTWQDLPNNEWDIQKIPRRAYSIGEYAGPIPFELDTRSHSLPTNRHLPDPRQTLQMCHTRDVFEQVSGVNDRPEDVSSAPSNLTRDTGAGVRAAAVHPGGIHTELARHMDPGQCSRRAMRGQTDGHYAFRSRSFDPRSG